LQYPPVPAELPPARGGAAPASGGGAPASGGAAPRGDLAPARVASPARATSRAAAVTIGVGAYAELAQLAAREFQQRTGLQALVLGESEFAESGLEHPALLKFRLFDLLDFDDLLYFDADVVCLADWDPRPLLGGAAIACVRERMVPLILDESARWGVPPEEHFNSGMFTVNRHHHALWLRRAEARRRDFPTSLNDQLPLNAARRDLRIPLNFLDRQYNWLGFGASSLSHELPVVLAHRKRQLAATFWGQAWVDNLACYADLANRLPRGRSYLRNGSVLAKSSSLYERIPHASPMSAVKAKPTRFSSRHALNHAMPTMVAFSSR